MIEYYIIWCIFCALSSLWSKKVLFQDLIKKQYITRFMHQNMYIQWCIMVLIAIINVHHMLYTIHYPIVSVLIHQRRYFQLYSQKTIKKNTNQIHWVLYTIWSLDVLLLSFENQMMYCFIHYMMYKNGFCAIILHMILYLFFNKFNYNTLRNVLILSKLVHHAVSQISSIHHELY